MKFTDEELSRILSAHEGGQLRRMGEAWCSVYGYLPDGYTACVIQAGKVVHSPSEASMHDYDLARWFDRNYEPAWTASRLLRELEKQGCA